MCLRIPNVAKWESKLELTGGQQIALGLQIVVGTVSL
jgi:hypothetical protein